MSNERARHPKNAAGPFYVVDGCCTACMAPHAHAPTLMGFDDSDAHCFVKQQPQTEDEIYMAIRAVRSAEFQCIRYSGQDPEILRRLVEIGEAEACDLPPFAISAPILRNYVTFTDTVANEAMDVAVSLRDYILSQNRDHIMFKVTHPHDDGEAVRLACAWYEDHYYELFVEQVEPMTKRWLVRHSSIWEVGSVGLSLILDDWLRTDPQFSNLRWYTSEAWNREGDEWQERPY